MKAEIFLSPPFQFPSPEKIRRKVKTWIALEERDMQLRQGRKEGGRQNLEEEAPFSLELQEMAAEKEERASPATP